MQKVTKNNKMKKEGTANKADEDSSWVDQCDKVKVTLVGEINIPLHIPKNTSILHLMYLTYLDNTQGLAGGNPMPPIMQVFPDLEEWEAARILAIYILFSSHKL